MTLDLPTLFITSAVIDLVTSLYFLLAWLSQRGRRIYLWLAASSGCATFGCLMFMSRNAAPDWIAVWLASICFIQTFAFFLAAVRIVVRKPVRPWTLWVGAIVWTGACLVPPLYAAEQVRNAVSSVIITGYCVAMCLDFFRASGLGLRFGRLMAGAVLLLDAALSVWTIVFSLRNPGIVVPLFEPNRWSAIMLLVNLITYLIMLLAVTTLELDTEASMQRQAARTDSLTGLLNRRAFLEAASDRIVRDRQPAALLMLDIDHFKAINDGHGHAAGDAALRAFADEVARQMRDLNDRRGSGGAPPRRKDAAAVGRLGGEEFACLLPHGSRERAAASAEALRSAVARMRVEVEGATLSFTVSAGLAVAEAGADVDALLRQADRALYEAKHGGRDRVVVVEATARAA
ncbi:GGDEF domain-containing protein [Methylobacterium aquaticum]|uniref:GGDEF domain-containing protein n=1 Tax=Methylobacterium aquaticum TaxID=270351 RepID=UPI0019335263|nr:GGDEF domain-containing protein [Methylobacterium aquaticum]QRE76530.1 GGDEF domain-containing protein [Methylobacterium aquaticum]